MQAKKYLNDIRSSKQPISVGRKALHTLAIVFLGLALGTFSKYLDFHQAALPRVLAAVDGALELHNFLGRFAVWALIGLCISVYSNSAIRAAGNVFVFFAAMVASYYFYTIDIAGFFPKSEVILWSGVTVLSPLPASVCWYAKGNRKPAWILSSLILAVLFNMCFVYGRWYFEARSSLEAACFLLGVIVLRRDTPSHFALMLATSIALAILLNIAVLFHFG